MGMDFKCSFNLRECIDTLGIEERGRVQNFVTESVLNLAGPYVPNDLAEKYENPHRLQDSGHIEMGQKLYGMPLMPGAGIISRLTSREHQCAVSIG